MVLGKMQRKHCAWPAMSALCKTQVELCRGQVSQACQQEKVHRPPYACQPDVTAALRIGIFIFCYTMFTNLSTVNLKSLYRRCRTSNRPSLLGLHQLLSSLSRPSQRHSRNIPAHALNRTECTQTQPSQPARRHCPPWHPLPHHLREQYRRRPPFPP